MQLTMAEQQANQEWIFQAFAETEPEEAKAFGSDDVKTFEGKPLWKVGIVVVSRKTGRPETAVFIKTLERPEIKPGEYRLAGQIRVTPFVSNGRQAFSIIADSIEPVAQAKTPFTGKEA